MKQKSNQIRANRVLGFFVAKGYLVAPHITPQPNIKLDITDVVFVADNFEPRVWEVLPAALLSFPASFLRKEDLPDDFLELLENLKKEEKSEQLFRGIAFNAFKRWMKLAPKDKRARSYFSKRKPKTYRLSPETIAKLKMESTRKGVTETEVIESLVRTLES